LVKWAKMKGLALLGSGDCTHPQWMVELKKFLKPASGRGIYEYDDVKFLLTGEVSCQYTRAGRTYRIHHIVFVPNFSTADRLNDSLARHGDLETEARPTVSLTAEDFVKAVLDVSPECLVVPAHPWGLQYSLFSQQTGYEQLADAYGGQADNVRVMETGLSCDPADVRRFAQADGRTLISNSDATHPFHLGREANIFDCPIDYKDIAAVLLKNDRARFLGTVELFPEADRFYWKGHKACQKRAASRREADEKCPACGKPFAPAEADRMDDLADRTREQAAPQAEPFHRVVPLHEIIAEVLGFQPDAETVQKQYHQITTQMGPELEILLNWPEDRLRKQLPLRVAESVLAVRRGEVTFEPGYDGVPGKARIKLPEGLTQETGQLKLF
ncbi:MAG TPA: endonuclease Q family protein, partial [Elusimicrobiota bacterium]|nr:endonuclease Q family protein [Elusimicrobiota bacterium]